MNLIQIHQIYYKFFMNYCKFLYNHLTQIPPRTKQPPITNTILYWLLLIQIFLMLAQYFIIPNYSQSLISLWMLLLSAIIVLFLVTNKFGGNYTAIVCIAYFVLSVQDLLILSSNLKQISIFLFICLSLINQTSIIMFMLLLCFFPYYFIRIKIEQSNGPEIALVIVSMIGVGISGYWKWIYQNKEQQVKPVHIEVEYLEQNKSQKKIQNYLAKMPVGLIIVKFETSFQNQQKFYVPESTKTLQNKPNLPSENSTFNNKQINFAYFQRKNSISKNSFLILQSNNFILKELNCTKNELPQIFSRLQHKNKKLTNLLLQIIRKKNNQFYCYQGCSYPESEIIFNIRLMYDDQKFYINVERVSQRQSKLRLQQLNQYKDKLIKGFSHELLTPLNCIFPLLSSFQQSIPSQLQIPFNYIKQALLRLKHMINVFISYSIILRVGKGSVQRKRINIKNIINEMLGLFKYMAKDKGIKINCILKISDYFIYSDQTKIKNVLFILLSNSLKFTNQGTVSLYIIEKYSNLLEITIKDTGIGISQEMQKKLFKLLKKFDAILGDKHGSGLGLFICKSILEVIGPNDINILSKQNQGTQVSFKIYYDVQIKGKKIQKQPEFFIRSRTAKALNQPSTKNKISLQNISIIESEQSQHSQNIDEQEMADTHHLQSKLKNKYYDDVFSKRHHKNKLSKSKMRSTLNVNKNQQIEQNLLKKNLEKQQRIKMMLKSKQQFQRIVEKKSKKKMHNMSFNKMNSYLDNQKWDSSQNFDWKNLVELFIAHIKILIVDDTTFNYLPFKNFFKHNKNIELLFAINGKDAIEVVKSEGMADVPISIIFMDINMPIMDGNEAIRILRGMQEQQQIPEVIIITVSAFNREQDRKQSIKNGSDFHLGKPVSNQKILHALQVCIQSKRSVVSQSYQ